MRDKLQQRYPGQKVTGWLVTTADVETYIGYACECAARAMPAAQRRALAESVVAAAPIEAATRLKTIAQKVQQISRKLQEKEADGV